MFGKGDFVYLFECEVVVGECCVDVVDECVEFWIVCECECVFVVVVFDGEYVVVDDEVFGCWV